jgi:hypothetical protein
MALTYITKAAEAASKRNQQTAAMIQQITKRAADKQAAKNAKADAIVQEGRQYGNDFYKLYDEQEKSGIVSWNSGASALVGRLASEQEELYTKAFGSNGTPELRNEFRIKQSRDKQVLSSIGQWASLSNQNSKAMSSNQDAHEQNIDLGRMTRGNDTEKYEFAQNMQNNRYSNYDFQIDESGNVVLNATAADADGNIIRQQSRNLSADVANNTAGNTWYSSIEEDDLLQNSLGKRWNDKVNGYSNLFSPIDRTVKKWDKDLGKTTETKVKVYDPAKIKSGLLTTYSSRLDAEIRGPGFEKTWDQLWRNGYLRDDNGTALAEGEISWRDVRKISTMNPQQWSEYASELTGGGDVNADGVVNEEDKKLLLSNVDNAAKIGLANYYSEEMAPQEDQVISVNVQGQKPAGTTGAKPKPLTQNQIIALESKAPVYQKLRTEAVDISKLPNQTPEDQEARASRIADDLNNNNSVMGNTVKYVPGYKLNKELIAKQEKVDEDGNAIIDEKTGKPIMEDVERYPGKAAVGNPYAIYKVKTVNTVNRQKGEPAQTPDYEEIMTTDNVLSTNSTDLTSYMSGAQGIETNEQTYLRSKFDSIDEKNKIKAYDTKEEADAAAKKSGGSVIVGTGKNKGKFIVK